MYGGGRSSPLVKTARSLWLSQAQVEWRQLVVGWPAIHQLGERVLAEKANYFFIESVTSLPCIRLFVKFKITITLTCQHLYWVQCQ